MVHIAYSLFFLSLNARIVSLELTLRTTSPPKLCAMNINGRSTQPFSRQFDVLSRRQASFFTFRSRLNTVRSLSAVVRADCLIASGPNQFDLYPYRMIRAFGTTAGSIPSSCNQFTQQGSSLVPQFLLHVSSGCAPSPWTAIMLQAISETKQSSQTLRLLDDLLSVFVFRARRRLTQHLRSCIVVGHRSNLRLRLVLRIIKQG